MANEVTQDPCDKKILMTHMVPEDFVATKITEGSHRKNRPVLFSVLFIPTTSSNEIRF